MFPSAVITVENVRIVELDNLAVVYITATDGTVYKGSLNEDESLILIRTGEEILVNYEETDFGGQLRTLRSWERSR